jgi:hypothetical protein
VPLVDGVIAHRLTGQVAGDGEDLEAVLVEDPPPARDAVVLGDDAMDVEVAAPAGDLETVVAPAGGQAADLLEGQVGELAGEERVGPAHGYLLVRFVDGSGALSPCLMTASADLGPDRGRRARALHGVQHPLHVQPVGERGRRRGAGGNVADEVGHLVDERVLVPEPASATGTVPSYTWSSLSRSKSNARLPSEPLSSIRIAFLRPAANRVASKVARAPFSVWPKNAVASSTVTSPVSLPPLPLRPVACLGRGAGR